MSAGPELRRQDSKKVTDAAKDLFEGARIFHSIRGPGCVANIDHNDPRGKPFGVAYDNGEFHRYSATSAIKLNVLAKHVNADGKLSLVDAHRSRLDRLSVTDDAKKLENLLDPETVHTYLDVFMALDHSNDDTIDVNDLVAVLEASHLTEDAHTILEEADLNGHGRITFTEFMSVVTAAATHGNHSHKSDGFFELITEVQRQHQLAKLRRSLQKLTDLLQNADELTTLELHETATTMSELAIKLGPVLEKTVSSKTKKSGAPVPSKPRARKGTLQLLDAARIWSDAPEPLARSESSISQEQHDAERREQLKAVKNDLEVNGKNVSQQQNRELFPEYSEQAHNELMKETGGNANAAFNTLIDASGIADEIENEERLKREKQREADEKAAAELAEAERVAAGEAARLKAEEDAKRAAADAAYAEKLAKEKEAEALAKQKAADEQAKRDAELKQKEEEAAEKAATNKAAVLAKKAEKNKLFANNTEEKEKRVAELAAEGPKGIISCLEHFITATEVSAIMSSFELLRGVCDCDHVEGLQLIHAFKQKLGSMLSGSCAGLGHLFELLEKQVEDHERQQAKITGHVVCVGAGPVGLRMAVELAMCGAKVTVVEMRTDFTRANILKLWPFLVTDLRNLGAKLFFPQFCCGGLKHIGTKRLQEILLKDALLLGVNILYGVQVNDLVEPSDGAGWHLDAAPRTQFIGQADYEIAAHTACELAVDHLVYGVGQMLPDTDDCGKMWAPLPKRGSRVVQMDKTQFSTAIGLVVHFVNTETAEESALEEQAGIARQFNLSQFNALQQNTMAELENVVYYRGETHYWVMTPTIESLVKTGVLTRLAPSKEQVTNGTQGGLGELLRWCYATLDANEYKVESFEERVCAILDDKSAPSYADLKKLLWKHGIDECKVSPFFAAQGKTKAEISIKGALDGKGKGVPQCLKKLTADLFKMAEKLLPQDQWPKPEKGQRVFTTHGRTGSGGMYIVNDERLQAYARNVAGFFRPFFAKKTPDGEYVSKCCEAACIFNFDQILEVVQPCILQNVNGKHLTISLAGDSLKEPFWPQGTGINRGVLGVWDTVHMLNQLEGKLDDQTHTENLLAERERAFKEYRQADTPYPTDGVMEPFNRDNYKIDPITRYKKVKFHKAA